MMVLFKETKNLINLVSFYFSYYKIVVQYYCLVFIMFIKKLKTRDRIKCIILV